LPSRLINLPPASDRINHAPEISQIFDVASKDRMALPLATEQILKAAEPKMRILYFKEIL